MSNIKFISQYGRKKLGANDFSPEMDVCDQRAPTFNVDEAMSQFTITEEIQDELDAENLEDFDNDVYPYDDISEYGEDILTASQPEVAKAARKMARRS